MLHEENFKCWHFFGKENIWGAMMRFHLLGLAHVPTRKDISTCAYSQKIIKLSKMLMDLGNDVFFYGVENSEVNCTEFIQCLSENELRECYGDYDWSKDFFKHSPGDSAYNTFNSRAIEEIKARKHRQDILLITFGNYQKFVADNVGLEVVESGVGYEGIFSRYRVFESYVWMHHVYGLLNNKIGHAFDAVIPNYFDPEDFRATPDYKDDYFLYIGRLIQNKGVEIAIEVCSRLGKRLVIAGQGKLEDISIRPGTSLDDIEFVGSVGPAKRQELMAKAKATFVPTLYLEPFGGVAVESQMCGTPVITTDWGAFTETVLHGITGYRCRTFDDFIWATNNIGNIDPWKCVQWATSNYSMNRISKMYKEYFDKIMTLWGQGWYTENMSRSELDWLTKYYPK